MGREKEEEKEERLIHLCSQVEEEEEQGITKRGCPRSLHSLLLAPPHDVRACIRVCVSGRGRECMSERRGGDGENEGGGGGMLPWCRRRCRFSLEKSETISPRQTLSSPAAMQCNVSKGR